jgi:hypothetical protein
MRQCDISNTKTPKVPQHTCAVGNLVQAFYTNQSCYSARMEDIPDLFGIVGKAKFVGVLLSDRMYEIDLLESSIQTVIVGGR